VLSDYKLAEFCQRANHSPVEYLGHDRRIVRFHAKNVMGQTYIAIQGTRNAWQTLAACKQWPRRSPIGGWVGHHGAQVAAEWLFTHIRQNRRQFQGPFTIVGHSMGGIVGLGLAAFLTMEHLAEDIRVVSFGAPKLGMECLAEMVKDIDITLYRNGNDPVPLMPFKYMPPIPYRHVRECRNIGESKLNPYAAHNLARYCEALSPANVSLASQHGGGFRSNDNASRSSGIGAAGFV
jgi:hypothetical protein